MSLPVYRSTGICYVHSLRKRDIKEVKVRLPKPYRGSIVILLTGETVKK